MSDENWVKRIKLNITCNSGAYNFWMMSYENWELDNENTQTKHSLTNSNLIVTKTNSWYQLRTLHSHEPKAQNGKLPMVLVCLQNK